MTYKDPILVNFLNKIPAYYFILILCILILNTQYLDLAGSLIKETENMRIALNCWSFQRVLKDFYLLASPYTLTGHQRLRWTEMTEWQCEACCPQAINRASPACITVSLQAHLKGLQQKRAWCGSHSWCSSIRLHSFVRQDKCTCRKNYTKVLTPTSYHPANWENSISTGGCLQSWLPDFFCKLSTVWTNVL